MKQVLKLKFPINAHGEMISQLEFKEPVGADVADAGYPFRVSVIGKETQRVTDTVAITKLISRLAEIPLSSVGQLSLTDWQDAMVVVLDFFRGAEAETAS